MMKSVLAKNLGMKLLSLLIAMFLWFYVAMILDPQVDVSVRGVPVVMNTAELKSKNLIVTQKSVDQIAHLDVRGSRTVISRIHSKNVSATIDLAGVTAAGSYEVPIQLNFPVGDVMVVKSSDTTCMLTIEALERKTMTISVETQGEPAEGWVAGKPVLSISSVSIEGPRSVVRSIEKAVVRVNVQGANQEVVEKCELILLASDGVEIEANELLAISVDEISATVAITEIVG